MSESVPFAIETLKGPLTEQLALDNDLDIRPELSALSQIIDFQHNHLELRRSQIEQLISRHLGITQSEFVLSSPSQWIWGSFNICLPIDIKRFRNPRLPCKALIRFPLPFRVGEAFNPGTVDEKLRCEAATYIWLQRNCPTVPIPRLLGIGFPGKQSFTAIENESWRNQFIWYLRCGITWLRCGQALAPYSSHDRETFPDLGYLLLEYVDDGAMLSSSWQEHRHDEQRRQNLYRSLSKIMLTLAKVPNPRIGSWTMNNHGIISLTNRPFTDLTLFWNKFQIPNDIPRSLTYTTAAPFIHDMLRLQDNRLCHQPNAILSKNDGIFQISALAGLRAMLPKFWDRRSDNGRFVLTLPDMHQSNIFVDDEWNITRLIDLEFAPVCPMPMAHVPIWLSGRGCDEITGPHLEEYEALHNEFVGAVETEELASLQDHTYSQNLREDWKTGRFWHSMAWSSINAFPLIFEQHFLPGFFAKLREKDGESYLPLIRTWDENALDFIAGKLKDKEQYEKEIHDIFVAAEADDSAAKSDASSGDIEADG